MKINESITLHIPNIYHKMLQKISESQDITQEEVIFKAFKKGLMEEYGCPLDHTPNAETIKALEETDEALRTGDRSQFKSFDTVDELFEELMKDDEEDEE
jgi:antitoxin component of RelBE/YafQ-DinJ toxin-antitoxin module